MGWPATTRDALRHGTAPRFGASFVTARGDFIAFPAISGQASDGSAGAGYVDGIARAFEAAGEEVLDTLFVFERRGCA